MRQFTCPKAVTHPSTNRARCRATALIETNALPLHQTANHTALYKNQALHLRSPLNTLERWPIRLRANDCSTMPASLLYTLGLYSSVEVALKHAVSEFTDDYC